MIKGLLIGLPIAATLWLAGSAAIVLWFAR